MESSFDFSIRLVELVKYLRDENREFPLEKWLLIRGNGVWVNLRMAELSDGKERSGAENQALACAVEIGYMLKLMAKTGYLDEQQSMPLREDCDELVKLISDSKKKNK